MEQVFHAVRLEVQAVAANGETVTPVVPGADGELREARAELSGFYFVVHEVVNADAAKRTGLKEGTETTNSVRFPIAPAVASMLAAAITDQIDATEHELPADPRDRLEIVRTMPAKPNRAQRRGRG
jgi:hypothetical protein